MNIVYVGDNRNRGNFGCRATSTALSQLISKNNNIVGIISGKYTNSDKQKLFVRPWCTEGIYKFYGNLAKWDYIKTIRNYAGRAIKKGNYYFSSFDFITYDFDKSIERLIKCLPANPELKEMDLRQYDFDALVVNGEGSFIFATPPWRECFVEAMLMHWALKLGKKIYYLNGMLSDDPYSPHNSKSIEMIKPLFKKAEVVQVRENESLDFANSYFPGCKVVMKPDALFSWYEYINDGFKVTDGKYFIGLTGANDRSYIDFDFSHPYICVAGSSSVGLAAKTNQEVIDKYTQLVKEIKKAFQMNVFLVEVCEGDSFLRQVSINTECPLIPIDTPILAAGKILSNAKVFISGRYHPGILASLGGTPCVFMSSNSHKTHSLQELLQYKEIIEFPVLPDHNDCCEIIKLAKYKVNQKDVLRNRIQERSRQLCVEANTISDLII